MKTPRHLFNTTAKLEKRSFKKDEGEGTIITAYIVSYFKCRVVHKAQTDDITGTPGRQTIYKTEVFCGPEVDLAEGDRITIKNQKYRAYGPTDVQESGVFKKIILEREI